VGSAPTVLESNWDVADHDYTKGSHTEDLLNLTEAEDDLITQLTQAMEEVPPPVSLKDRSPEGVTISIADIVQPSQDLATPDILKELLDFQGFENVTPVVSDGTEFLNPTTCTAKQSSPSCSERAVSPISKEQILDFLQDKVHSPSPSVGSESGYDSIRSPSSLGSPDSTDHSMELDMDSFSELFPSLF